MNKTYKIQLPRNKEAYNIKTNIKDGTIEVEVELNSWRRHFASCRGVWWSRDCKPVFAMRECPQNTLKTRKSRNAG